MASEKPAKFGLSVLAVIAAGIVGIVFFLSRSERSFPLLPAGAYVGQLVGAGITTDSAATLYIEKPADRQLLLLTIFAEGWEPRTVGLREMKSDDPELGIRYQPIQLQHQGMNFSLAGQESQDGYSGDVLNSDGGHGTWVVRSIKQEELGRLAADIAQKGENLEGWLDIRRTHRQLQERFASLEQLKGKKEAELEDMQAVLDNEEQLKRRAEAKLAALTEKVETARKNREKVVKEVKDLVGELDLLGRITKKGKVVRLARKVASRENKWYLANWGAAQQELSAAEEQYAESMSIDLGKLDKEYRRAREITSLQRELERERALMIELRRRMQQRIAPREEEREGPTRRKRRIWDRLFG